MAENKDDKYELVTLRDGESTNDIENTAVSFDGISVSESTKALVVEKAPVKLTFKDLEMYTRSTLEFLKSESDSPNKTQKILKGISGHVNGGLWAIMGPSGSGKTSLLNVLSLRVDNSRSFIMGEYRLNGRTYDQALLKSISGYVMQDDLLHSMLTVYDTLYYTAQLRMACNTEEERAVRVKEVLELMGLTKCRDTFVGDSRRKGISGGERKRLCIGMELISRPKLLFLDEPTSGLDSRTALDVITSIKNLTTSGECTVISSIHQPNNKIYNLFDNLILMQDGNIMYQGSIKGCETFFADQGIVFPKDIENPADFVMDYVSHGTNEGKEMIVLKPIKSTVNMEEGIDIPEFPIKIYPLWIQQLVPLVKRGSLMSIRRWDVLVMGIIFTSIVACFVGSGSWYQIGTSQTAVPKKINPLLFFFVLGQGIASSFMGIYSFPNERALMLRERQAGTYQVSSYFISKTVVDFIFKDLPLPIIYCCWAYWLSGLDPQASKFVICTCFLVLTAMAANSCAVMLSCIFVSVELTSITLGVVLEISRMYGGFLISPAQNETVPGWIAFSYLSYLYYGYIGVALNEYQDETFYCKDDQFKADGTCPITTGEQVIKMFGYDQYTIGFCFGCLLAYIVVTKIIAYIFLKCLKF